MKVYDLHRYGRAKVCTAALVLAVSSTLGSILPNCSSVCRPFQALAASESTAVAAALSGSEPAKPCAGCTSSVVQSMRTPDPGAALPERLLRVPLVRQATDYTCGVAALEAVLAYYGVEAREDKLSRELHSNSRIGTAHQQIERVARSKGLTVETHRNLSLDDLRRELDRGHPVICCMQAWTGKFVTGLEFWDKDWDDGHYVVVAGYDQKSFYFMDPSTLGTYAYLPVEDFDRRWHDTDGEERLVHFGMAIWKDCKPVDTSRATIME